MYCNDASLRSVTKSLYRTAPPFSILNGRSRRKEGVEGAWASFTVSSFYRCPLGDLIDLYQVVGGVSEEI